MACYLTNSKVVSGKNSPVIDQRVYDNPDGELPVVSRLRKGDTVGYKYFDFGTEVTAADISIDVNPASQGRVDVLLDDPRSGEVVATIDVDGPIGTWATFTGSIRALSGKHAVYLVAHPDGQELGDLAYLAFAPGD
jgi:arabinoxylan arabinofuranohydrolase